jgi:hypothetical protein
MSLCHLFINKGEFREADGAKKIKRIEKEKKRRRKRKKSNLTPAPEKENQNHTLFFMEKNPSTINHQRPTSTIFFIFLLSNTTMTHTLRF